MRPRDGKKFSQEQSADATAIRTDVGPFPASAVCVRNRLGTLPMPGYYGSGSSWRFTMRIGAALLMIAVGALMRFAVTLHNPKGFNIHTAGVILIVIGALGLIAELIYMSLRQRRTVVQQTPVGSARTGTYVDPPPPGY